MTCGIYLLRFIGTDKVYIGQSENIEARFTKHKSKLKACIHSSKLQEAYSLYGIPTLEILCECSKDMLDTTEFEGIDIFNSVTKGFNTLKSISGHSSLTGDAVYNAKYSNNKIIEVFKLLIADTMLSANEISTITGVSIYVVQTISAGTNHKWLSEVFPIEYTELLDIKGNRNAYTHSAKARGIIYPNVISPLGVVHSIDNVRAFARKYSLQHSNLLTVLNGTYKQHKGWKLAN